MPAATPCAPIALIDDRTERQTAVTTAPDDVRARVESLKTLDGVQSSPARSTPRLPASRPLRNAGLVASLRPLHGAMPAVRVKRLHGAHALSNARARNSLPALASLSSTARVHQPSALATSARDLDLFPSAALAPAVLPTCFVLPAHGAPAGRATPEAVDENFLQHPIPCASHGGLYEPALNEYVAAPPTLDMADMPAPPQTPVVRSIRDAQPDPPAPASVRPALAITIPAAIPAEAATDAAVAPAAAVVWPGFGSVRFGGTFA
ncbi:hypothetical protein EXIGLDRAFT_841578 [Exidia glandulosa HHB12029]|uniref:Uncharacterized protein n=1 Tax=Exidia glandulosa HHB12029 TaxID=1314781 RepID=A0A165DSR1_EXIGL|nr:hypothetical protein EXIGLDRAFT_841578 [Exidia glandulosa HHB12029]